MATTPRPRRRALFSICAANYLARVTVLMESAARFLPEHDRILVLAADHAPARLSPGCRVLTPDAVEVKDLGLRRRIYNVTELCTSIKPDVFRFLLGQGYDEVLYFDPDIRLFAPPAEIDRAWKAGADLVLTPHVVTRRRHPPWVIRAVGLSGQFNLGFLGVARSRAAAEAVAWWQREVAMNCVEDAANGVFVDQKIADFFVPLFPGHAVVRHPGYNVAYWNLHERPIERVAGNYRAGGRELAFFHFSGFNVFRDEVSRHLRGDAAVAPPGGAVAQLLREYAREIVGHGELAIGLTPYTYDRIGGSRNSALLRQGLRAAAAAGTPRIDPAALDRPKFLTESVPARHGGGTAPRILRLLAQAQGASPELRREIEACIEAAPARRQELLVAILHRLHPSAAIDVRTIDTLLAAAPANDLRAHLKGRRDALSDTLRLRLDGGVRSLDMPVFLLLMHHVRPDLAQEFRLGATGELLRFLTWFIEHGMDEYSLPRDAAVEMAQQLDRAWTSGAADDEYGDTPLAGALGRLFDTAGALPGAATNGEAVTLAILSKAGEPVPERRAWVYREWLWHRREGGAARLVRQLAGSDAVRTSLFPAAAVRRVTQAAVDAALDDAGLGRLRSRPENDQPARTPEARRRLVDAAIVGPFTGHSGVGFSADRIATLLRATVQTPVAVDLRTRPRGIDRLAARLLLLHVNADVTFDAVAKYRALWSDAERRVGYWYWELPEMSRRMATAAVMLDEIWVASTFVRAAVAAAADLPVHVIPPPIDPALFRPSSDEGGSFGAARRRTRFLAVVDLRSFVARKNPEGVVRSFRQAFPKGTEAAELIVKLNNGHHNRDAAIALLAMAEADRRIRVIDGTLSALEMNDLYQSADCFVSLHRAEGLGLGIVQAMMQGKAVIATGYSGPMDFLTGANAFLVPFRMVPVPPDSYPDWIGQVWAEPDEAAATVYMRELARRPEAGREIGARAARDVTRHFAPERVRGLAAASAALRAITPAAPSPAAASARRRAAHPAHPDPS